MVKSGPLRKVVILLIMYLGGCPAHLTVTSSRPPAPSPIMCDRALGCETCGGVPQEAHQKHAAPRLDIVETAGASVRRGGDDGPRATP